LKEIAAAHAWAAFVFVRISRTEVFNMFVENSVQKGQSIFVSDSRGDASADCTGVSAGLSWQARQKSPVKSRLDKLLVNRGLAASRERAQALVLAGKVLVDEQKMDKAGAQIDEECAIRLLGEDLKYVSRGGLKLERALEHWRLVVSGKLCVDVGASAGGVTDCLLQRAARRGIAVDTGYGQMDFNLRQDPRVRLLEKTNARYVTRETFGEAAEFIAMDVSFISATLVLPPVISSALPASPQQREEREIVVLVKPQFEAGREHVGKGGIVRDEAVQLASVEKVRVVVRELGAVHTDFIDSPILGAEGNREFLLYGRF